MLREVGMRNLGILLLATACGSADRDAFSDSVGSVDSGGASGSATWRDAEARPDGAVSGSGSAGGPPDATVEPAADAQPTACVPGRSVACVGPGGCSGGQACSEDGRGYGPCECAPPAEDATAPIVGPNGDPWVCVNSYAGGIHGDPDWLYCACVPCGGATCESRACGPSFCCIAEVSGSFCACMGADKVQADFGVFTCAEVEGDGRFWRQVEACPEPVG